MKIRNFGFQVSIIDVNAEEITEEEVLKRIKTYKPRLIVFVVYGQNVNAGTTNMEGAIKLSNFFINYAINFKFIIIYSLSITSIRFSWKHLFIHFF